MSEVFRRTRAGGLTARFTEVEAEVLRGLVLEVLELLGTRSATGTAGGAAAPASSGDAVADELERMLGSLAGPEGPPDDPVLARLLPDAHLDDLEAADEFRHYTEGDLVAHKTGQANVVLDMLPPEGGVLHLDDDQADAWLGALNDVRLALGVALDVEEDTAEELARLMRVEPHSARTARLSVYHWLGYVQESLVEAIIEGGPVD